MFLKEKYICVLILILQSPTQKSRLQEIKYKSFQQKTNLQYTNGKINHQSPNRAVGPKLNSRVNVKMVVQM